MADKQLSTDSYKGVRDFYPADMAIQRHIFDTWGKTAESFGFERYDASILEPSDLYKAKGAENEEMVNEQTYTFTDRGGREVTLRPEMTPTVARMVAGKRRELAFPVRWYSIPNLFRYERPQRGRLREHWQLNCDIFGGDPVAADVEIISLAHQLLLDFGAKPEMFEIRINSRRLFTALFDAIGWNNEDAARYIRHNDRFGKGDETEWLRLRTEIVGNKTDPSDFFNANNPLRTEICLNNQAVKKATDEFANIEENLKLMGIENVVIDQTLARGFDYYTGTIFEIFDVSGENNRSMLGGGRYDNLTGMFGGEPISGVGFGMGDVTMRDFLETHSLLPDAVRATAPTLMIIPTDTTHNLAAQKIAVEFRKVGISVAVDYGTKKLGEKISRASERGSRFVCVVGEDEVAAGQYTCKHLPTSTEQTGPIATLVEYISTH